VVKKCHSGINQNGKSHIQINTKIQEKIDGGSHIAEVILIIEPKIMGLTK